MYSSKDLKIYRTNQDLHPYIDKDEIEPDWMYFDCGVGIPSMDVKPPFVALEHRCDLWVIGGLEEVNALIYDLEQVRDMLTKDVAG